VMCRQLAHAHNPACGPAQTRPLPSPCLRRSSACSVTATSTRATTGASWSRR
jgi:hypothetical protein